MVKVTNISEDEARKFLHKTKYGHLAYAYEGQPYIVPINFAYDSENVYFRTTDGTKTRCLAANAKVCLQVEQIDSQEQWESVMVVGSAEPITSPEEFRRADKHFSQRGMAPPPEMAKASFSNRTGENRVAVYRIRPKAITGRKRGEEE